MRLPLARFTVRWMMFAVIVAGLAMWRLNEEGFLALS
jgi:hypothetical protein